MPDAEGVYPEGSLQRAVADRMAKYVETLKAPGAEEKKPEPVAV